MLLVIGLSIDIPPFVATRECLAGGTFEVNLRGEYAYWYVEATHMQASGRTGCSRRFQASGTM